MSASTSPPRTPASTASKPGMLPGAKMVLPKPPVPSGLATPTKAAQEAERANRSSVTDFTKLIRGASAVREEAFTLNVKIAYLNKTVKYAFNRREKVSDQVERLCGVRDVPYDEDANYQVLLRMAPKHLQKYAIGEEDFYTLEDNADVRLVGGSDFVNTALQKISEISSGFAASAPGEKLEQSSQDELLRWCDSLLRNCGIVGQIGEWFASEVISLKGIRVLFNALVNVQKTENVQLMERIVGVIIGILTILLQFEAGIVWTEKELMLDEDLLESLVCVLFGKMRSKANISLLKTMGSRDVRYTLNTRKLASAFLCTMLQQFHKDVPLALNKAFMRQPDATVSSYYSMMVELSSEDPLYNLVLVVFLFLVEQDDVKQQIFKYLDSELAGAETNKWKKRANAPANSKKMLVEDSLLSSLATACAETERLELSGGQGGGGLATGADSIENLKQTLRKMDERRRKVEADLRKAHQAMCKMVELVDVDNALVNQSLRAIVRYGWDSIHWQKGYTCLHFAAECMEAPNVVELLALLAKDMNERDATGKRPLDYARKERKQANVEVLEKMRNQFYRQQQAERAIQKRQNIDYARQVEIPENLTPTLRAGIEAVLQMGWKKIKWPNGFSALHLAAQCGNLEVVKILLERVVGVGEDYEARDKLGNSPLDYAVSSKHEIVADYLRRYDPKTMGAKKESDEALTLSPGPRPERDQLADEAGSKRKLPESPVFSAPDRKNLPQKIPDSVTDEKVKKNLEDVMSKGYGAINRMRWPRGKSPLHDACEKGDLPVALWLLKFGADPYKKDEYGKSAISYADDNGFKAVSDGIKKEWKMMAEQLHGATDTTSLIAQIHALNKALGESHDALAELGGQRDAMEQLTGDKLQLEQRVFFLQQWINGKRLDEIGALHDDQCETYGKQLEAVGMHKLRAKLQESRMAGGLNLELHDAALAVEQLLFRAGKGGAHGIRDGILHAEGLVKIVGGSMSPQASAVQSPVAGPVPAFPGGKPGAPAAKGAPPVVKGAPPPGKGAPAGLLAGIQAKGGKGAAPPPGKGAAPPGKGAAAPPGKGGAAPPGKGKAAPAKGAAAAKGGAKDGAATASKGGKNKTAIDPTLKKPGIIPPKPMKPLWWSRLNFGRNIKDGETVWEGIEDFCPTLLQEDSTAMLDFVERFSKTMTAADKSMKGDDEKSIKKKELKELVVVTDAALAVGKQRICKDLPSPEILCAAIMEFDETIIDKEMLAGIKKDLIPDAGEVAAMEKLRAEHPDVPFALPEKYMWAIGHIPVYAQRLNLWNFTRNYEDRLQDYEIAYEKFVQAVSALEKCPAFEQLLGVALAAGNYLNGNTNRGQADGFELSGLSLFNTVKDNVVVTKKASDWIFTQFLQTNPLFAKARVDLMEELAPVFTNVKRRIAKDKDGGASMSKQAKYANEEFDGLVKLLKDEFDKHHEDLQMILGFFEDPTDPIRTVLVPEFESVDARMKELMKKKQAASDKMALMQTKFNLGKMTSSEFFLLIDDFLIPGDLILNKSEVVQKKFMTPIFCGVSAPTLDGMLFLWGLEEPREKQEGTTNDRGKRRARAQNRRGKKDGKPGGEDSDSEDEVPRPVSKAMKSSPV
ncbi:unnamed protein product [Amoebophrya sp. A120]|nr:unnamed protein product [Amoebophrya sp. A120]|eukprot:GSA120T00017812001.1